MPFLFWKDIDIIFFSFFPELYTIFSMEKHASMFQISRGSWIEMLYTNTTLFSLHLSFTTPQTEPALK